MDLAFFLSSHTRFHADETPSGRGVTETPHVIILAMGAVFEVAGVECIN